jgi:deazaflavin-dependent oxidoreductase (nitroreductase family)
MSSARHQQDDQKREAYLRFLRRAFKGLNKFILLLWRLRMGWLLNALPRFLGRYMVLIHIGRKTGKTRQTPVNYAPQEGVYYCTAAFGKRSHWYQNIMAQPDIQVWLPDGRYHAHASDITESADAPEILRAVLLNSGFAASLFEGLRPARMTTSELEALIGDMGYRLLRIETQERL